MAETTDKYCQKGDILGIEYIVKNHKKRVKDPRRKPSGSGKSPAESEEL